MDAALCCKQRCTPSSGMAQPTARQGGTNASVPRMLTVNQISAYPCCAIEHLAGPEHRMRRNGQLTRDRGRVGVARVDAWRARCRHRPCGSIQRAHLCCKPVRGGGEVAGTRGASHAIVDSLAELDIADSASQRLVRFGRLRSAIGAALLPADAWPSQATRSGPRQPAVLRRTTIPDSFNTIGRSPCKASAGSWDKIVVCRRSGEVSFRPERTFRLLGSEAQRQLPNPSPWLGYGACGDHRTASG